MSTYTNIVYQVVFSTKGRLHTLQKENRKVLFSYIHGILTNKNCHTYRINGVENHIHIVFSLHPSISLANLVKDIKIATSELIKRDNLFPLFNGWQVGYGAFTYSKEALTNLIQYVINQEEHHKVNTFEEEYRTLLKEHEIEYDEKYLFKEE
jgi:REP element-mobilizing transposase RayT